MAGPRIVVAMSGGVDSSVAAALLKAQGFDVIGVSMQLSATPAATVRAGQGCCSLEDFRDARRVAERLAIPYYVWNLTDVFRTRVTDVFASEYVRGRTPNPCVLCNRDLKFDELRKRAGALGATLVATGHYARILREDDGRFRLLRARDERKDQSYFLFSLTQEELARTRFPLGDLTKEEVRRRARALDLSVAEKPESQEICFVPDRDYAKIVAQRGGPGQPGPIVTREGVQVGQHEGLFHYTLGQRKGLGIAAPEPYYVIRKDAETNTLIVGFHEETFAPGFRTGPICWGGLPPQDQPFTCRVQLRSHHAAAPARVHATRHGAEVVFEEPQRSPTPGQWAVFYDDAGYVLASGNIREVLAAAPATA
ncbi:MAG: tRNA 2-thiouridine(34) synthase MnmA [Trueperaceae bacterium]|nr:tRNA 2-thiouridine(34) synthase MnmA [Trueperaceae bacterium]